MKTIKLALFYNLVVTGFNTFCMEQDEHNRTIKKEDGEEICIDISSIKNGQKIFNLIPEDIWNEIASYLDGDDIALNYFLAPRMTVNQETAKKIAAKMIEKAKSLDQILEPDRQPFLMTSKSLSRDKIVQAIDELSTKIKSLNNALSLSTIDKLQKASPKSTIEELSDHAFQYIDIMLRNEIQNLIGFDPGARLINITENSINSLSLEQLIGTKKIISHNYKILRLIENDKLDKFKNVRKKLLLMNLIFIPVVVVCFVAASLCDKKKMLERDKKLQFYTSIDTNIFATFFLMVNILFIIGEIIFGSELVHFSYWGLLALPTMVFICAMRPFFFMAFDKANGISPTRYLAYFFNTSAYDSKTYMALERLFNNIKIYRMAVLGHSQGIIEDQIEDLDSEDTENTSTESDESD